jgi:thioredoxin reductase (NADPH)
VIGIDPIAGGREGFVLSTRHSGTERRYRARRLILATGGTDRPRRLNIPGEDLPHVSHYFQDPHTYFRTRLLIVGGKNSAVEAALRCHHAGAQIAMSYRRAQLPEQSIKYWLMPEIKSLLKTGRIESHFETSVVEIVPGRATLRRSGDGAVYGVPADFVLLLIGYEQDNTLFKLAGVEIGGDCGMPLYDDRTMETNVPNLYLAGTAIAGTQEKYRVFIENCHVHAELITAALTGSPPPASAPAPEVIAAPES